MSEERRYDRDEVAQIFEAAVNPGRRLTRPASSTGEGMTLAELQAIGREVGLAPESIADAAHALEHRGRVVPRTTVAGVPIGVGRIVDLPRAPTDREWEIILSELRETFAATGRDSSYGGVRRWTNGNLHAYVEPTESGHRLRLGTRKGDAAGITALGVGGIVFGLAGIWAGLVGGGGAAEIVSGLGFGLSGTGALGFNAARLPRWARRREEQMEYIAGRVRALIQAAPVG
jgi:hypothetical protein